MHLVRAQAFEPAGYFKCVTIDVQLEVRVVCSRAIDHARGCAGRVDLVSRTGATIGYGAIFKVQRPSRIATIACGYADGFLRALSVATGEAGPVGYIGDYPVPIVGRVSMDFITVDVTDVPEELTRRGGWVEVMGERVTVDDLTDKAGTIGYELLSRLGPRVHRVYEGA